MSGAITIRPETRRDHPEIGTVVAAAFGSPAEALLVERIRSSPEYVGALALVAERAGRIVGHVMVSGAILRGDRGDRRILMLSPLAVAPAEQRSGIGTGLVRAVTTATAALGEPLVVLEGSPAYYGPLGFEPASAHGITMPLPAWAPPEAAQVMLFDGYDADDPTLRGEVIYPDAFADLDG